MRKLKFSGAVLSIIASLALGAHAAGKPPCSGDAAASPDDDGKKKESAPKDGEKAPPEDAPTNDTDDKNAPKADAPKEDAPKADAPKEDAPKEDAPKQDAPRTEAPKEDAPKAEAPKEDAPKEDAPKKKSPNEEDGGPGQKRAADDKPASDDDAKKDEADKAAPPPEDKPAAVAPKVSLNEPKLVGGEVKLVSKMLQKTFGKVAACVKQGDGLDGGSGYVELQFMVRVRGRAEGVEVRKQKGVSKKAAKCVQKLLKNYWVGTPSNDPVGVTFRYELKAP